MWVRKKKLTMTKDVDFSQIYKNLSPEPLEGEIFGTLMDCNDNYEVSNFGRIFKMPTKGARRKRLVPIVRKHHKSSKGYHSVSITYKDGIQKNELVHRLVARVFLENPDNLPCVNHKDGVKSNLCAWNLEWCTVKHNMQHAWRTGLIVPNRGENHYKAKLSLDEVEKIRTLFKNGGISGRKIAEIFGISTPAAFAINMEPVGVDLVNLKHDYF